MEPLRQIVECRLLPDSVAAGATNMAADETMLQAAVGGLASLRFYQWAPPTLSLGYFQPERMHHGNATLASLPLVRRPTGGTALVHDQELTYALAIPAGPPFQTKGLRPSAWIDRMHAIIRDALAILGLACASADANLPPISSLLCFHNITAPDLLMDGHKVVGSAQRKQRGALLQHGGILLAQSSFTPSLPGIKELAGVDIPYLALRDSILPSFTTQTGWNLVPSNWTPAENARIAELATTKYQQDAWNRKR
jgi:lipoate-protein ligase A